jgi:hypothetical protein
MCYTNYQAIMLAVKNHEWGTAPTADLNKTTAEYLDFPRLVIGHSAGNRVRILGFGERLHVL